MPDYWPAIVFGWPAVTASVLFYVTALAKQRAWLAVLAALISAPFCVYASGIPIIRGFGFAVLALNLASAAALRRRRLVLAGVCLRPYMTLAAFLAMLTLAQPRF